MSLEPNWRFNDALISTCRTVLRSTGDHQGPPLQTFHDAVTAELSRLHINPSREDLLTSAVLQAAHCAGYERRTPIEVEMAWLGVCSVVDDYRRAMVGAVDVPADIFTEPERVQIDLFEETS